MKIIDKIDRILDSTTIDSVEQNKSQGNVEVINKDQKQKRKRRKFCDMKDQ